MDDINEIISAAYLLRASPETVYEWLKAWPRRRPEDSIFSVDDIPEELEHNLLAREDEIIDLALAAWGTHSSTIKTLYERRCARSVVTNWPPKPSTYPHAILASILANVNTAFPLSAPGFASNSMPPEDFDWLVEHSDVQGLFRLMHENIALGYGLLRRCAEKDGAYGRIDDNRWLFALGFLGNNKSLHRIDTTDSDGPDLDHSEIHQAFVQAATVSPKTSSGAIVAARIFQEQLSSESTDGAYVSDEQLAQAVMAWDVEVVDDDKDGFNLQEVFHELDALTASERVRFHLLRHYCLYLHLDPDDSVRVRRLAAYSKNPPNGGAGWGTGSENQLAKYTGKGLDIDSFKRYSERDGPAFMYAISYNGAVWSDKTAVAALWESWGGSKFPAPKDSAVIRDNRHKSEAALAAELAGHDRELDTVAVPLDVKIVAALDAMKNDLAKANSGLGAKIGRLSKLMFWGGVVLVGLVLFSR